MIAQKKERHELLVEKIVSLMKLMESCSDEQLEKWDVSLAEPIRIPTVWTIVPYVLPVDTTGTSHSTWILWNEKTA